MVLLLVAADVALSAVVWQFSYLGLPKWSRDCTDTTAVTVFYGGRNWHSRARLDAARQVLTDCASMRGILVGGARPGREYWGSEWMKTQLVSAGIAASRLTSERWSYHSRGNVRAMIAMARSRDIERLVLVSDPLHLHRLLFIARSQASQAGISLETIAVYPTRDTLAFLWRPHYEALAWLAGLLPEQFYERVLRVLRR